MIATQKQDPSFGQIRNLLDRYGHFVVQSGKSIYRAEPTEAERMFAALSEDQKKRTREHLEAEVSILEDMLAEGESPLDSRRHIWRHLAKSGYTPCSDIFDKIDDTDVVEVYNRDLTHVCQNLNFFDWVSLTLDRIFCETLTQLGYREPSVTQDVQRGIGTVLSDESRKTFDPNIDWHWVNEVDTEMLYRFQLRVKCVSPVFLGGRIGGFICISECRDQQSMRTVKI